MRRLVATCAAAAALLAASAQAAPRLDTPDAVRREMAAMFKLPDSTPGKAYDARAQALVNAPAFDQLSEADRCFAYWMAGFGRGKVADWKGADAYYIKAVACPDMPMEAWDAAYDAALRVSDWDAAVRDLQMLAEHWPAQLSTYDDDAIFRTLSGARRLEKGADRQFALLDLLYDIGWKPSDPSVTLDQHWASLAASLYERGLTIRAGRVAQGVRDPWILAAMRADKRFDALFDHASPDFDPETRSRAELEFRRKLAADHPEKLGYVVDYADDLTLHGHAELALKLLDEAQNRIDAAPKDKPAYADLMEKAVWVKDYRRRALLQLGRVDEALALEIEASNDKERGRENVSQIINLAGFYDDLGQPQQALDTLARLKGETSPFGRMQVEKAKAIAYAQLGDKEAMARSIAYLREHDLDAPGAAVSPLLWANDLDAVAAFYIGRLEDPDRRLGVLGEMQDFADPPHPLPSSRTYHDRWMAMRARPDVQAAIAKVGRINRYSFQDE